MKTIGYVAAALFVATVWLANYLIGNVGTIETPQGVHLIPVGFGLTAPSGVLAVGLAFTLRDIVHRTLGRAPVVLAILIGAVLSYFVNPAVAVASGVAFLLSEFADLAVYEPLERRSLTGAVLASNTVGAVVDSALFLYIAFGSLAFIQGQIVGKTWMTLAALPLLFAGRKLVRA